jgi:predicted hydrocarbon binding protein
LASWFGRRVARKFSPMFKAMYATMGDLNKAFYEKFGDEALPIITKVSGEGGQRSAKIIQEMMPVKNMTDVGELFKMMETMMDMKMEIIELSDDMIHFKTSTCPMGIEGTSKELCEAMMTSDKMMLSTLLGQEMESKITASVAAGDEYCEVIFSIKQ